MIAQEYLTICLIEELAELQQALSKCLRFGPHDHHPSKDSKMTNLEDAKKELSEVFGILGMLNNFGVPLEANEKLAGEKVERTLSFMQYSKEQGVISETSDISPSKQS